MTTLLMLKGLPASGKSTFAMTLVGQGYVRVNKDDLRQMLHGGAFSKGNEKQVLAIRDAIIVDTLARGRNVVVDDTNFAPRHEVRLRELANEHGAEFKMDDHFLETPIEQCIDRDLKRLNSVGERVIRQMYNQYVKPPIEVYTPPEGKPMAIMCDIDGTIAHTVDRGPYDEDKVGSDAPDWTVIGVLARYRDSGRKIILMSGRHETCREATEVWLAEYGVPYDLLLMRAAGDNRKDFIIKRELFEEHIRDHYRIEFVLDDRNQVVATWRQTGLQVFQVADGDF